jgi:hypothetical protein
VGAEVLEFVDVEAVGIRNPGSLRRLLERIDDDGAEKRAGSSPMSERPTMRT